MMIFDTHAHYTDEAFDSDRDELLASFPKNGIGAFVEVASTKESNEAVRELIDRIPFAYGAFGIHPDEIGELDENWSGELKHYLQHPKAVAVGEIGLDYHWMIEEKSLQIQRFEEQLEVARECHLPVIIHSREAASDTLETAKRCHLGEIVGVMHCYSYSPEMAKEYLKMGLYLGIGGVVTFKNARKLKEIVQYASLESLVLETDCPYLAPEPHRGTRNSSLNLHDVVKMIAQLKNLTPEEVEMATWENARRLYRLVQ
jgi:TatD DNase family protein